MYCTNCGTKIAEGHKFCTNCGKNIMAEENEAALVAVDTSVPEIEAPKRAGLDVAMLVWSIMCVELCASLFSIPSVILTVLAAFNTEEEAAFKIKIAKGLNIVGMVCFAALFAFFIFMISVAYWTSI